MDEEMEINNNDLNNNTDFEEEGQVTDQMADMAEMNAHDIMKNTQQTLLRDAGIVRQRIGYKVSVEEVYHHLEVVMDHENRIDLVVEDLQGRINNGEFASGISAPIEEVAETVMENENSVEPNESLAYVDDDDSELEDEEEPRPRTSKRKIETLPEEVVVVGDDSEVILDEQIEQINGALVEEQENFNATMERDLENLSSLFPTRSIVEMRDMYLAIYQIEKANTVNMLAQQLYDAQDAGTPPKRPRLDNNVQDEAGPSGLRSEENEILGYVCSVLYGIPRKDIEQKCRELNWDQNLISGFVDEQMQTGESIGRPDRNAEAGPSTSNSAPESPQPGPSTEPDDHEVEEEDSPEISEKMSQLIGMFPDADPEFLRHRVLETLGKAEEYTAFINDALENKNLPSRKEYEERKKKEDDFKKFTGRMTVKEFLKNFPNPKQHFESNTNAIKDKTYKELALNFLYDRFPMIQQRKIKNIVNGAPNMSVAFNQLLNVSPQKTKRRSSYLQAPTEIRHLYFLQEATYLNKKAEIEMHVRAEEEKKKRVFEEAKARNELLECPVCCDDECLFEDMTACAEGHLFCKNCLKKYAETNMGDNKSNFPCLDENCNSTFPLPALKNVLEAKAFACLVRRMQTEEIRQANIQDLETCPFCDFGYIPDENNALFECQSETCRKVSCRKCKEENHLPLRCEEVERDAQTQARKKIEEAMTGALIRECYKCKNKFVKTEGCNKMTCPCGAKMCYLCRQPVKDYNHFSNGPNGQLNPASRCPLYTHNDELHVRQVVERGEQAKREAEEQGVTLTHDPTAIRPQATAPGLQGARGQAYLGHVQEIREALLRVHNQHYDEMYYGNREAFDMRRLEDLVMRLELPPENAANNQQRDNQPQALLADIPLINVAQGNNPPPARAPAPVQPANPYRMPLLAHLQADRLNRRLQLLNAAVTYLAQNPTERGQQALNRARQCIRYTENELQNLQGAQRRAPNDAPRQVPNVPPPAGNAEGRPANLRPHDVYMALLAEQRRNENALQQQIVRVVRARHIRPQERNPNAAGGNPPQVERVAWNYVPQVPPRPHHFYCFLPREQRAPRAAAPPPQPPPPPPQNQQRRVEFHRCGEPIIANRDRNILELNLEFCQNLARNLQPRLFPQNGANGQPQNIPPAPAPAAPNPPAAPVPAARNPQQQHQGAAGNPLSLHQQRMNDLQLILAARNNPNASEAQKVATLRARARELINTCHQTMDYFEEEDYDPEKEMTRYKRLYLNVKKLKDGSKYYPYLQDQLLFLRNRFRALEEKHRIFKTIKKGLKEQRKNQKKGSRSTSSTANAAARAQPTATNAHGRASTSANGAARAPSTSTNSAANAPSTSSGSATAGPSNRTEQDDVGDTSPESDDYVSNFEFED